jgi:hypothetical protein
MQTQKEGLVPRFPKAAVRPGHFVIVPANLGAPEPVLSLSKDLAFESWETTNPRGPRNPGHKLERDGPWPVPSLCFSTVLVYLFTPAAAANPAACSVGMVLTGAGGVKEADLALIAPE